MIENRQNQTLKSTKKNKPQTLKIKKMKISHFSLWFSDLFSKDQRRPLCNSTIISIVLSISKAMLYLHEIKVLHCDLKSSNVLITSGMSSFEVKLCDFGLSAVLETRVPLGERELTVVLVYYESMETYSRIELLRS